MTVGDIKGWQVLKRCREIRDPIWIVYHPHFVTYAIGRCSLDVRRTHSGAGDECIDVRCCRIRDHDGPGLRIHRLDLAHAVALFDGCGELVFADEV